ncbi:hypothetical protein ACIBI4_33480 [Streptomyces sp. NPDC050418]|uniref:hypothetical protein n=1 Tax=Streptomyces sp. NPDC050418 TaxID=3365612 RepID=UPI003794BF02
MSIRIRKRTAVVLASAALLVAASATSLHLWWNTDTFGAERFCDDALTSSGIGDALDGSGRLSEVSSQNAPSGPEFTCSVERTSRFIGADELRLTVKTSTGKGAFPFTTAVWKEPAARSYFTNGAVSDTRGYAILPKACWNKVGAIQGSRVIPPGTSDGQETVAFIEAVVDQGEADRAGLARLLSRTAEKVAREAGCSGPEVAGPGELSAPGATRATDARSVCGVDGFALPPGALVKGKAEPGKEQLTGSPAVWACDLRLSGDSQAALSFSATSNPAIIEAVAAKDDLRKLPDGRGVAGPDEAVLRCEQGDVYFAANRNFEYRSILHDATESPSARGKVRRDTFQAFLDAAGKKFGCK